MGHLTFAYSILLFKVLGEVEELVLSSQVNFLVVLRMRLRITAKSLKNVPRRTDTSCGSVPLEESNC